MVTGVMAGLAPSLSHAGEYDLSNLPLIVSVWTPPNVFLEVDDSGSMDWEILSLPHYSLCAYDGFVHNRTIFGNNDTSGTVQSYCEMYKDERPAGDARMLTWVWDEDRSGNKRPAIRFDSDLIFDFNNSSKCNESTIVERCENKISRTLGDNDTKELDMDWRIRSSDLNVVFYNPAVEYTPWVGGSTTYANAKWDQARSWPNSNDSEYKDTRDFSAKGFQYNVWIDDKGYKTTDTRPKLDNMTSGANGEVDLWDSYVRVKVSNSAVTCEKFTITAASTGGMDADKTLISDCSPYTGKLSLAELQQNIANWFQYYRRRVHVANAGLGRVLTDETDFRYGMGLINSSDISKEMPDKSVKDFTTHITSILDILYKTKRASGSTPLRGGLKMAGDYYAGDLSGRKSPITLACQKNFTVLFTDGYWNDQKNTDDDHQLLPIKDTDGDGQKIYGNQELQSTLLADVARYYYEKDLRKDLDNIVPTDSFDSANHQHMVTYTINFGSQGLLVDENGNGWPGKNATPAGIDWYSGADTSNKTPSYWDPRKADDMWHAAWNSRGTYIAANSPQQLIQAFSDALDNINSRVGSAAAAGANSGSISSTSKIFQAKFDTFDWHGELLAFPVKNDGTLGEFPVWNADTELTKRLKTSSSDRNVFTMNGNSGVAFEWAYLNAAQKDLLDLDFEGTDDGLGESRLSYIRGVDSGNFRTREHKLGDIVNSDPTYVGYPPFFYSYDNYQAYFTENVNRTGMVYFGANDGMFHGIRESDGKELFSYIPNRIIHKLSKLTDPDFEHEFYVDGQPEFGDVQIGGDWKSIISAGLRAGGQGYFALDVTKPDTFNAKNVLWEFTDANDADLGYGYSQPQIKRMANGKWAIIIGNGINNTEADGNASTTGTGAIYILFIEDGIGGWSNSDFVKITVPGGSVTDPNAVFTPAAADIDGDSRVDYIYAGDRNGKMWKFDVSSKTPGDWGIAFNGKPLFDAGVGHPITDRPAIDAHPMGRDLGQLVLFGTGQYIELSDTSIENQPTQSMYAIWDLSSKLAKDHKSNGYARSELSESGLSVQSGVRIISSGTAVDWFDDKNLPNDRGWYVDLPDEGERIRRRPILRDNQVFFVTLIPDDDPCAAGGTGWLMVLDTRTGQAPGYPVFDINGDLDVTNEKDLLKDGDGNPITPAGISSPSIPNLPAIIYDDRPGFSSDTDVFPPVPNSPRGCDAGNARAYTFTTQSNGSIMAIETASEALTCGRQGWISD
jgi:type IV pilus assembly protein PilY1